MFRLHSVNLSADLASNPDACSAAIAGALDSAARSALNGPVNAVIDKALDRAARRWQQRPDPKGQEVLVTEIEMEFASVAQSADADYKAALSALESAIAGPMASLIAAGRLLARCKDPAALTSYTAALADSLGLPR